jgi:hypothetical protein
MPCEELQVGLTQNPRPAGALDQNARPSGDGFCRDYIFSGDELATFAGEEIHEFGGSPIYTF